MVLKVLTNNNREKKMNNTVMRFHKDFKNSIQHKKSNIPSKQDN